MNPPLFERMAVIGVGLLGGSIALASRATGVAGHVTGIGRTQERLNAAMARNVVDEVTVDGVSGVRGANLVVLSGPVGTFVDTVRVIRPGLTPGSLVTDVGSVKGHMVEELDALMPEGVSYVGSHPIAGGSVSGATHARADLFTGMRCVVTPIESTPRQAVERIMAFWKRLGADVVHMDPHVHDRVFAYVSHLPHLISYALIDCVGEQNGHVQNAGRGLLDTTRIAASPPRIWSDIFRMNRSCLLESLQSFQGVLHEMRQALEDHDDEHLKAMLERAKEVRDQLGDG